MQDARKPANLFVNRNFLLLWAAYGISALGDHLSEIGLLKMQDALEADDTTRRQALMGFAFMAPFFFFGPFAGWLADILPRKWVMFSVDVIRAGIMIAMLFLLYTLQGWWHPEASADAPIGVLVAITPLFLIGTFAAIFSPARLSLLPTLIRDEQFVSANALTAGLGMIATIASALLGGWLVDHVVDGTIKINTIFQLDALTFLLSAALIFFIFPPRDASPKKAPHGLSAVAQGFSYVNRHHRVLELMLMSAVFWAAAAGVRSIIPAVVKDVFGGSYGDIGIYQGLMGVGMILGAVALTILGESLRSNIAVCWCLKLTGLAGLFMTAAIVFRLPEFFAMAGLVMIGFFGSGIQVSINALLQHTVPNYIRGRVFGVNDLLSIFGFLLATGLLGIPDWQNIDRYVPAIMAGISVGLVVTGLVATIIRLRRGRFGTALTFWKNLNDFYAWFVARTKRKGLCTLPAHGPAIVVANHTSSLDPFVLTSTTPNRVIGFMIAKEMYTIPIFNWLCRSIDCIPVTRSGQDTASVKTAMRHLKDGKLLGIFPQGGIRDPEGASEARGGAGLLALRSGVPVIPAYIHGLKYSDKVIAPFFWFTHRATVIWGEPIDLSPWKGREKDREAAREVADHILDRIMALRPDDAEIARWRRNEAADDGASVPAT